MHDLAECVPLAVFSHCRLDDEMHMIGHHRHHAGAVAIIMEVEAGIKHDLSFCVRELALGGTEGDEVGTAFFFPVGEIALRFFQGG